MLLSLLAGKTQLTIATAFYALWRMICKTRLRAIYRSNPEARTFCFNYCFPGSTSRGRRAPGARESERDCRWKPLRTIPLLEYVERVNVVSEGSPVQFPPSTWIAHLQTLRRDHRTNNLCEGWNNKFVRLVGHSQPTTWNGVAAMQKDDPPLYIFNFGFFGCKNGRYFWHLDCKGYT